ncbi:MAG: FAD-binding oxidoreductase [Bacteroidales bacterium]|nr:FAD-binding oxidoreductase [Bacteroidales bacterium]
MNKIIEKEFLTDNTVKFVFDAAEVASKCKAGHFVFVHLDEKDRLTLSVADADERLGTITLVIEAVGELSSKITGLNEGDEVLNIEGPKGKAIDVANYNSVLAVGGAAGIAPMLMTVKELKKAGNKVISVLVTKSEEQMFFESDIKEFSDDLIVFTYDNQDENGLEGLIKTLVAQENIQKAYLMGPKILIKAAHDIVKEMSIAVQATLW